MGFVFREYDMILSFRYYLLTCKIRDNIGDGIKRALPDLYPLMKNDEDQWGIRLSDLYAEEKLTVFPSVGIINGGLFNGSRYLNTLKTYMYTIFLDAAFRADDEYGNVDRDLTFKQKELFFGDIRALLTDNKLCRSIPYYIFNDDGTQTKIDGYLRIVQNPIPKITTASVSTKNVLGLNADFQIQVFLQDENTTA